VKIVPRYVLREHLGPLVFALSALTSLLLLNFVAKKFGDLVGKGLPWTVIAEFLLLSIPFTLAMTLPMAVLVATLHAFSRFASENEITAFKASGVSMQLLVRPVIAASVVLTLFMVWFNDQVLPRANHRLATLQSDIARVKPTFALSEQVINEVVRGQLYLRAARIDANSNRMKDVVIYDLSDPTKRRTIIADSGQLAFTATGEDLILTLYDGNMSELTPQEPTRLQRNFFSRDLLRVRGVAARLDRDGNRSNYRSDRELGVCELLVRVRRAEVERTQVWARLIEAEGDGVRRATAPAVPGGLGALYCKALTRLGAAVTVPEAQAATPSQSSQDAPASDSARAKPGRPRTYGQDAAPAAVQPGRAAVPPPSAGGAAAESAVLGQAPVRPDSEVVRDQVGNPVIIEGLITELRMTQSAIDSYRVEIEKKFAIAAACIVFVLLGAPIALRFPGGGVGLTIGVSLGVFGLYYVGLLGGEALADRNLLGPAVAMWSTDVLLGAIGLYLTARLGNEGSTSRGSETAEWWGRLAERMRGRFGRRA
jgi:lipopolysaccharide export system permease protein